MKQTILCLFAFFLTASAFAQEDNLARITGTVKDGANDQMVELVTIYVRGTQINTSSSENGRYSLDVPANRDLELVFSRVGYKENG